MIDSGNKKLQQIQAEARRLNHALHNQFHSDATYRSQVNGGHLFAGRHYAKSDKMYISPNPGRSKERTQEPFLTDLEPQDWYWGNAGQGWADDYPYLKYANLFFNADPSLESWMTEAAFTCTFLMPWRTPHIDSLAANPALETTVWGYSGKMVRLMFEHCRPSLLVVSGMATWDWLQDNHYLNCQFVELARYDKGRQHQCRKGRLHHPVYGGSDILAIPHFSYARSISRLKDCASWLRDQLKPYGA